MPQLVEHSWTMGRLAQNPASDRYVKSWMEKNKCLMVLRRREEVVLSSNFFFEGNTFILSGTCCTNPSSSPSPVAAPSSRCSLALHGRKISSSACSLLHQAPAKGWGGIILSGSFGKVVFDAQCSRLYFKPWQISAGGGRKKRI